MKIEKLEVSNKKNVLIFISGFMLAILIVILVNYLTSRANYRNTQSIDLAKGTINYKAADFSMLAINVQQVDNQGEPIEDNYKTQSTIPIGNYVINENKTYCTVGSGNIKYEGKTSLNSVGISISYENNNFAFSGITQSPTKCYVFLDVEIKMTAEQALAKLEETSGSKYEIKEQTTFEGTSSTTEKVVYKLQDNDGDTYVFRGNPDNWVTFANKTWRIIRINGDGTLRLLYYCDTVDCSSSKNAVESRAYNTDYGDNTYVGFYNGTKSSSNYTQTHSNATASTIAEELKIWYQSNLENYKEYLSVTTGWCNDRTVSKAFSDYTGDGTGTSKTAYAARERFLNGSSARTSFTPKLTCNLT